MLDLIIRNGMNVSGELLEVGIKAGKISQINNKIESPALKEVDAKKAIVSAGWIDSHVHCYEKMKLYYDFPDEIGIKKGVTTVIDAGTAGEKNIKDFYELAKKSHTNVLALMNISSSGIVHQDELADLGKINEEKNLARIKELPNFIIGIKARMSQTVVGDNDVTPLKMAKSLQKKANNLPLMVHIGSAPPKLDDVLELLEAGDIVTHCYNGKPNGILDESGEIKSFVWEAFDRGVLFDIGHGTDSFNFKVSKKAIMEGLLCHTISTDIYHRNRESGPVFDLATTIEKGLSIGIPLEEAILMVTQNPAANFHLENKGKLAIGYDADLTLFNIVEEDKMLLDSNGNKVVTKQKIVPTAAIVAGEFFEIARL